MQAARAEVERFMRRIGARAKDVCEVPIDAMQAMRETYGNWKPSDLPEWYFSGFHPEFDPKCAQKHGKKPGRERAGSVFTPKNTK